MRDIAGKERSVAIVGAGLISDLHIAGVRKVPDVTVAAVVDTDFTRAKAKAARYGIPHAFSNQSEMLQHIRPDAVHVLTPPATHEALCIEALESGAHVYVEKPMAPSEAACARMIEAAARRDRELCIGHSLAFDPLLRRALDALDRGEVGDIVHASAVYCFDPKRIHGYNSKAWYRRLRGGFLEDLAAHPASVLLRIIGAAHEVIALSEEPSRHATASIAALIRGSRASGSLFVSLDARPEDVSLEIRGTRGIVSVNFSTMIVSTQPERKLPRKVQHGFRNMSLAGELAVQTITNTARFLTGRMDTTKGIHTLISEFYAALASGRSAPVGPVEGREVVRLLRTLWPEQPDVGQKRAGPRAEYSVVAPSPGGRMQTALVTGATGFIGTHLVALLAAKGVRVRALARDPRRASAIAAPNVEVVIGDLSDFEVYQGLAAGMDTVFHLASIMAGTAEEFENVDLAGTRRLIEEAKRAGVRRFVFTSTMGAYALSSLRDGAVVTEDALDLPERVGNYARAKLLIEEMLLKEHRAGSFDVVIARPGLVFGPGASPFLEHLPHLGSLLGNRYLVFGDGEVPLQLTYVENTVEALWLCGTVPEAAGHAFTIIDSNPPTQREFVRELAALTGRELRVTAIPRPAAYALGFAVEAVSRVLKTRPPTTRRLLIGKTVKLSFDTSRAQRVLGWHPKVFWREGLRRAVAAATQSRRSEAPVPSTGMS